MSAAGSSEEQFRCSICLEVFSEPVTTPCGHNFCKRCISQTWDTSRSCFCPLCKEVFTIRPKLRTNTLLSVMVCQFKREKRSHSMDHMPTFSEVHCDVCSEPKLKAVKSCLVCLSSFCESHLQPHLTVSGLKRHQLMEPVDDLEDRMCPTHDQPLTLYCSTDQKAICVVCSALEHKNHTLVPLKEAFEQEKVSLQQSVAENQHLVEQRRLKVQEIRAALEHSDTENHKEAAAGLQAFTVLMQSVQHRLDQFLEQLQQKQKDNQRQAQELLQQLQQEMCELEKSSTEAQQLSLSTDPLHFLQCCPALPPAGLKDWSSVSFEPQTCEGSTARALSELETSLSQEFNKVLKDELRRVQQFAVDITLDRDTAHPNLDLSVDLKQVYDTDLSKTLPDSPQRFDQCSSVLGKQSFSSGRFYFEVQVKAKTDWDLGVAQESIKRKGNITLIPENGFWTMALRNRSQYSACADPPVVLMLQCPPQKVGVFVDYGAGLVSFYDIDSADLIYSFTDCCFRGKILPYFSPCKSFRRKNSTPLIITTVTTSAEEPQQRSGAGHSSKFLKVKGEHLVSNYNK